jgi:branched-chain amino acid transport system ATP-binding protein
LDAPTRTTDHPVVRTLPNSLKKPPALSLGEISVRFGGVHALQGLSAEVPAGMTTSVVGPNGAGKTSLLNAISGYARGNTQGVIMLGGRRLNREPPRVRASLGVGRSFQDPHLIDSTTVLENLLVGAHQSLAYGLGRQLFMRRWVAGEESKARERAAVILQLIDHGHLEHKPVAGLPYGSRKLIDIGRALMSTPRLLLLDEPTSGLDNEERAQVARLLAQLRNEGETTLLMVEHNMDLVRELSDCVFGLEAGGVVASGTPDEVLDSLEFRAAIAGKA